MPRRATRTLERVLAVFLSDPTKDWYGLEIMDTAGVSSGTLYPLLHRLVTDGWLERTADAAASDLGGPSRRLYRITTNGICGAEDLRFRRHRAESRPLPSRTIGTVTA